MEAVEWARAHGATGDAQLVSDQPWARVTRVGGAWLKECAPVQAYEVPLTAALAARWPDRVPTVLAADGARLLLADAGSPIGALEQAMPGYAELQQGEAAHVAAHLAAGVPDLRAQTLPGCYEAWVEREPRLAPFRDRFAELCASLTRPPTVQHDDLHGANVYAGGDRLTILDWGDSCIAHPFATMHVTLRWTAHFHGDQAAARVRRAYLDAWEGDVDEELDRALAAAAFARALQWQRIGDETGVDRNLEVFVSLIASS
jgi:hypothetical protein